MEKVKESFLLNKLKENYKNLATWHAESKIPLSWETCRLAINENKPVSIPSLILICKYLNFTPGEIRKILTDLGDKDFAPLLGGGDYRPMDQTAKAILDLFRRVEAKEMFIDQIKLIARAEGINIPEALHSYKRR